MRGAVAEVRSLPTKASLRELGICYVCYMFYSKTDVWSPPSTRAAGQDDSSYTNSLKKSSNMRHSYHNYSFSKGQDQALGPSPESAAADAPDNS